MLDLRCAQLHNACQAWHSQPAAHCLKVQSRRKRQQIKVQAASQEDVDRAANYSSSGASGRQHMQEHDQQAIGHLSRRAMLANGAGAVVLGFSSLPAAATMTVELPDGTIIEAYEHGMSLSIVALRGSIPAQWIVDFRQALGRYAGFALDQRGQIEEIYNELSDPEKQRSAGAADVVTLGDAWMAPAISSGRIQPIPSGTTYRWWRRLPRRWQELVRRDSSGRPSPHGAVWGCPYRWGATLVAVKGEKLKAHGGRPVRDWGDLLQPQLRGRVAFPDSPREFVGIALKSLGLPLNATTRDIEAAGLTPEDVKARVSALRRQARLFSNRDAVRALSAGDVWALVGWSSDIVPLAERTPSLDVVAPASGTALWADMWVVPAGAKGGHRLAGPSPILPSWMEFSMMPERVSTMSGLRTGASPLLLPSLPEQPAAARHAQHTEHAQHHHRDRRRWPWQAQQEHASSGGAEHERDKHGGSRQEGFLQQQPESVQQQHDNAEPVDPCLSNDNGYLPPDGVLQRSEFLLPLDQETLQLYRWLLDAL